MSHNRDTDPQLLDIQMQQIADLYTSVLSPEPVPGAKDWLADLIAEKLPNHWKRLHESTEDGPTLFEVASWVFASSSRDTHPNNHEMFWLINLREDLSEAHRILCDAREDLLEQDGGDPFWARRALAVERALNRLRVEGWTDPEEILATQGLEDTSYGELLAVCGIRYNAAPKGSKEREVLLRIHRRLEVRVHTEQSITAVAEEVEKLSRQLAQGRLEMERVEHVADWLEDLAERVRHRSSKTWEAATTEGYIERMREHLQPKPNGHRVAGPQCGHAHAMAMGIAPRRPIALNLEPTPQELSRDLPKARLSCAEWELMCVIWKLNKAFTTRDIHHEILKIRQLDRASVNTLLRRLEEKGWITFDRTVGRPYPGRALIHPKPALVRKVNTFLHQDLAADPEALAEVRRQLDELTTAKQKSTPEGASPR